MTAPNISKRNGTRLGRRAGMKWKTLENNKFKFECIKIWNLISIKELYFLLLRSLGSRQVLSVLAALQMNSFESWKCSKAFFSLRTPTARECKRLKPPTFAKASENVWLYARDNTANFPISFLSSWGSSIYRIITHISRKERGERESLSVEN